MNSGRFEKLILIVEDDTDIAETISSALSMEGLRSAAAMNGREALDALERGPLPSLIILDISMPVMDGAEFLTHFKSNPCWSSIPVILMSAANDSIRQGILQEVSAHVHKPMDVWEFLNTIKGLINNNANESNPPNDQAGRSPAESKNDQAGRSPAESKKANP